MRHPSLQEIIELSRGELVFNDGVAQVISAVLQGFLLPAAHSGNIRPPIRSIRQAVDGGSAALLAILLRSTFGPFWDIGGRRP